MKIWILIRIKLMRLPFVMASVIPFLIGAGYVHHFNHFNIFNIFCALGLLCATCSHIGANVFNDYFDSKSGNDWQDKREHIFFGGSKIIQNGLMREKEVFRFASFFIILAALSVIALQVLIPGIPIILFGVLILFLAVSYSAPPLKFAYTGWGELVIFILFGPASVLGAYTILTGKYFGMKEILVSFPIAFLVTAILYANEVPDYNIDKNVNKKNLIVRTSPKIAWIGYIVLILGSAISLLACIYVGSAPKQMLFILPLYLIYIKPLMVIKNEFGDIERLKIASKLTITGHTLIGLGLTLAYFCA
ncbi:MAG: prenyltransferase [Candidatus Omnitrophica bacterium]|nr:prenyltransferase [Candidatus Omnitrophota bacterium]